MRRSKQNKKLSHPSRVPQAISEQHILLDRDIERETKTKRASHVFTVEKWKEFFLCWCIKCFVCKPDIGVLKKNAERKNKMVLKFSKMQANNQFHLHNFRFVFRKPAIKKKSTRLSKYYIYTWNPTPNNHCFLLLPSLCSYFHVLH
jgi:hypothetical protein